MPPTVRRAPTVIALLVGTFMASLDVTLVGTAMPRIIAQLHGMASYGAVFSAYLVASTAMVPLYGKLADVIGRKRTYYLGLGVFLVGSAMCGAAPTMTFLVVARAVQGLGAGALQPVTMTIVGDLFAIEERSKVQGLLALVWGVSSVIGPAVGGLFVTYWTWRWAFYINVPIGVAATLLLASAYREAPRPRDERPSFDIAGALCLGSSLVALLLAFGGGPRGWPLAGVGTALLGVLLLVERSAKAPVVPPQLFRDPVFLMSCLANLLLGAVLFAFIANVPLYLQGVRGISPLLAGILGAPTSFTWTLGSFMAGRWIVRVGYRPVLRVGALTVVAAAASTFVSSLPSLPTAPALGLFEAGQLLLGAGMGLTQSALVIVVQDRVGWAMRGAATAMLQMMRWIGATLGTTALAAVAIAMLTARLAPLGGGLRAESLVDPSQWRAIPEQLLTPGRLALGAALGRVSLIVVALAALAMTVAWFFPDVRASVKSTQPALEP